MNKQEILKSYKEGLITIFDVVKLYDKATASLNKEGVVYTPEKITKLMVEKIKPQIHEKIVEFCVGHGSFVFAILEYFKERYSSDEILYFMENNLYAHDIIEESVSEFKAILQEYCYKEFKKNNLNFKNIYAKNSLDYISENILFDVSIGNPPFVKYQNLSEDLRICLKEKYKSCSNGNVDLYFAFLELAQKKSKRSIHIVQSGFLINKSAKSLRNLLLNDVNYIKNYKSEQVFEDVITYSVIVGMNANSKNIEYDDNLKTITINNKDLLKGKEWNLDGIEILQQMGNKSIVGDRAQVYSGIETLANSLFIHKGDIENGYLRIDKDHFIEEGILMKYIKVSKVHKKEDIENNIYYAIYPYDINGKIISEDDLKQKFPNAYKYLLSNKDILLQRDKGKIEKHESWYAYGRKQGFPVKYSGKVLLVPNLVNQNTEFVELENSENYLIGSGFFIKTENLSEIKRLLNTKKFKEYIALTGKVWKGSQKGDYFSANKKNILSYPFEITNDKN